MEEFGIGSMSVERGEPARYFVRGSGVGTSRLWYAAIVPMLGVYIEMNANSLKLGVLVWALAAVMGVLACLFDLRFVRGQGVDTSALSPFFALCPPLYIFRRTKLTGDSSVCGAVCCIMIVYALMFNGFTSAATMKKSEMTSAVKGTKWSYIDGMNDVSSDKTIEETLEELGGELEWDGEKRTKDGYILVTCESKDTDTDTAADGGIGGEKAEVSAEFRLDFDGFYVGKYHLEELTVGEKTYTSEEAAEYLKEFFGEDDESEADEEKAEDEDKDGSKDDDDSEQMSGKDAA